MNFGFSVFGTGIVRFVPIIWIVKISGEHEKRHWILPFHLVEDEEEEDEKSLLVCWERQKLTLQRESRRRECCYEKTTADACTSGASAPKFWAQIEAKVLFGEQTRHFPQSCRNRRSGGLWGPTNEKQERFFFCSRLNFLTGPLECICTLLENSLMKSHLTKSRAEI